MKNGSFSSELTDIYLSKISETIARCETCDLLLAEHCRSKDLYFFESAVLQLRKALEAMAFSAIAPNKPEYQAFRQQAEQSNDYRRDFHAKRILQALEKVNPDFYPEPLMPAQSVGRGQWHFERRMEGHLTKEEFSSLYDRLGKFLHADNPWGNPKDVKTLASEIPGKVTQLKTLLSVHFTTIRTKEFGGVWVVEVPSSTKLGSPRLLIGEANGDFAVR